MATASVTTASVLVRIVAGAVLTATCGLLVFSTLPVVLGWRSTVVLSGSMTPRIQPGDVVASAPFDEKRLIPGQVILVRNPSNPAQLLMHRFVGRNGKGQLVTRGDANREADSNPVRPDQFVGLPRLRVPWVGLPSLWLRQHRRAPLLMLGLGFVAACVLATGHRPYGSPLAA